MYDLIIRGGTVVDGSGAAAVRADVGVLEGRITGIGDLADQESRDVIDASGLVVSPGFIDVHTHSDFTLLHNPQAQSKVRQGVTTEIGGNCGFSVAPVRREKLDLLRNYVGFMPVPLPFDWEGLDGFLGRLERQGIAVNFGSLIGHGAIRIAAMGFEDRPPSPVEMEAMKKMAAEALDQGASGLSLGPAYPPGSFATKEELTELARVVAGRGGLITIHLRSEGDRLVESVEEAIALGRETGVSVHISHHKASEPANWGKVERTLAMIEEANRAGFDVTCDVYPYTAGFTTLSSIFPLWAQEGGTARLAARCRDAALRPRLIEALDKVGAGFGGWDKFLLADIKSPANQGHEGSTIADLAGKAGLSGSEAVLKLMDEENGSVGFVMFSMCEEDVETVLKSRYSMIGSDGKGLAVEGPLSKGRPHPRNYGAYPRVLARYVRERGALTLEEAVRKMTSTPAARFRLRDRGLIRKGYIADIAVFDPRGVADLSTFADPHRYPAGIPHVIVGGLPVIRNGAHTGVLSGTVLR